MSKYSDRLLPSSFLERPIAHRGLHDFNGFLGSRDIENSIGAIVAAARKDYAVEIDVRETKDGVPVVFHDETLSRLAGREERISELRWIEIKKVLLANRQGIPTLARILDIIFGKVPLLIDIKDIDGTLGPTNGIFEKNIVKLLTNYNGPVAVMSFNPFSISWMQKLAPEIPCGLVTERFKKTSWPKVSKTYLNRLNKMYYVSKLNVSFISHSKPFLSSSAVSEQKNFGRRVLCWTVRSRLEETEARKYADNVTFEGYVPE